MKERLATCTQSGLAGTHESGAAAATVRRIMCLLYCITSLLRSTHAYYSSVNVRATMLAGFFAKGKEQHGPTVEQKQMLETQKNQKMSVLFVFGCWMRNRARWEPDPSPLLLLLLLCFLSCLNFHFWGLCYNPIPRSVFRMAQFFLNFFCNRREVKKWLKSLCAVNKALFHQGARVRITGFLKSVNLRGVHVS